MRRTLIIAVLAVTGLAVCSTNRSASGCGDAAEALQEVAKNAVSEDPKVAEPAIQLLRKQGPVGLQALLTAHADAIKQHTMVETLVPLAKRPPSADEFAWQRLRTALDEVSGQRDCHVSHLFWYTDFDEAKAAAKREGKPILSLRLLGKLTDEYSCANSRFFRTTLYSNAEISKALGERFVLHWKSVRPVPKVTIDFGDGRKLERTLTGNSIHYILDADGQVIDALPGLYGPQAFLRELERAEKAAKQAAGMSNYPRNNILTERQSYLADYHRERAAAIETAWQQDLKTLGINLPAGMSVSETGTELPAFIATAAQPQQAVVAADASAPAKPKETPSAIVAGRAALGKGRVELPIIKLAALSPAAALTQATTDDVWNRIAGLHTRDSQLDAASVALIRSQHPAAAAAARRAISKMAVEDPLVRMVRTFQGSIAVDTVRNEYVFHRQIHQWLANGQLPPVDTLNERVYAELFLTPSSDPWLGLMPADTYTALENNGVEQVASGK